jgi:hypothetical protein
MDKKTVFIKTAKGENEGANLSSDLKRILSLIDNKSRADELAKRAPPSLRSGWMGILAELVEGGYIRDKNMPDIGSKIATPKSSLMKMFTPKPDDDHLEELDFNTTYTAPAPSAIDLEAKKKAEEASRIRAEMEAAVAAAKDRANAEAIAKAEAKARQEAENAAKARALAEAEEAAKAEAKAKYDAENAARARAAAEAKAKQEAELQAQTKAKQEAAARLQEQQEAARAKAALEEALRVRAEIEAAARAQQQAEAKAKKEAEAIRLKAEQEAAKVKAELEAAARAKAEAEAARVKAEQEAARIKAEMEAAKARAEAEAKALAEARARQLAEEKARQEAEVARLKAEQEAAIARLVAEAEAKAKIEAEKKAKEEAERLRVEQEAAIARAVAEAEAKARREAEEKALLEAETIRLRAEQEATIARVMAEAEAKARLEAEEKAILEAEAVRLKAEHEAIIARAVAGAEEKARMEAEAARLLVEKEAARIRIEHEAMLRAAREGAALGASAPSYEIQLDDFLSEREKEERRLAGLPINRAQSSNEPRSQEAIEARVQADKESIQNAAAEMARLKEEAEAARRKMEEEALRLAEERALAEEQAKAWSEAEQRAKAQAIIEAEQAASQAALYQAKATQKPVTRKHRNPLPWGKIVSGLFVLALLAVLVLPYVYPLTEYIAPLEQRFSARLKQPVHIGGITAASFPPMLKLQNVTVGNAQEVKIGNARLKFEPLSLFSEIKVISDAELDDVSIQGDQLDKQAVSLKLLGGDTQYPVRHMTLQRVKIVTDEVQLPPFSGIAELDVQGMFSRIALHSDDDRLGFDLQPNQGRWQIGVTLKEIGLPFLPDVVFGDLSAKGDLNDGEINFTEFDAHLFDGILLGSAKLNWRKGWQLQGHYEAKLFELNKMFPKYRVEGEMYGEGTFSLAGAKLSQLDDTPRMDGSFSVKNGTVSGFDMVETARTGSRENLVGGRMHFDEMIGLMQLDNHVTHFRQVRIVASALSASGSFDVSSSNQLSGNFNADIKMKAANNNLILYGTLAEPKLRAGN